MPSQLVGAFFVTFFNLCCLNGIKRYAMRRLYLIFCFLGLALTNEILAQQPFNTVFFDYNYSSRANDLVLVGDSVYYIAGQYEQNGLLVKTDTLCNLRWSLQYASGSNTIFNNLIWCSDGNMAITGRTASSEALIMKVDTEGDTLWTRALNMGSFTELFTISQTSDSGFVVCGYNYNSESQMIVAKTDKLGMLLWSNTYTLGNNANYAYSAKEDADGNIVVAAFYENYPPYETSALVLKLKADGSMIWAKKYNPATYSFARACDVVIVEDGYVFSADFDQTISLFKTDTAGNFLWNHLQNAHVNSSINVQPIRLHIDAENKFYLAYGSDNFTFAGLIEADSMGMQVFNAQLYMVGAAAVQAPDGGYMCVGNGPIYGVKAPTEFLTTGHFSMHKTDSAGNSNDCSMVYPPSITTSVLITQSVSPLVGSTGILSDIHPTILAAALDTNAGCVTFLGSMEEPATAALKIFPNPSDGAFTIEWSGANGIVEIFNSLGVQVYAGELKTGRNELCLSGLVAGIYYVRSNTGRQQITQALMIK